MTDGVSAGVDAMKARARQPVRDLMTSHSQLDQLAPGHHAVLASGELRDRLVHLTPVTFSRPERQSCTTLTHRPIVAVEKRRGAR